MVLSRKTAAYPIMDGPPDFVYRTVPATYKRTPYTDYYFVCRIHYSPVNGTDNSTFEIALVADGSNFAYPSKIAHADNLNVTFNSSEVSWAFGHTVSDYSRLLFITEVMKS